jgi:hypothetical protein
MSPGITERFPVKVEVGEDYEIGGLAWGIKGSIDK